LPQKLKPSIQTSIGEKMTIAPTVRQPVEQKKESATAYGEQEATDSMKPLLAKEVVPKKHDEKRLGAASTPKKLEEVGPSDALKKPQPKKLPLAYNLLYVIRLAKFNSEPY